MAELFNESDDAERHSVQRTVMDFGLKRIEGNLRTAVSFRQCHNVFDVAHAQGRKGPPLAQILPCSLM